MAKKKKRAPGGGRKPKGDFSQLVKALTIRMPADMRKQLDVAASHSGRSVTQELLGRVRSSFYRDREKYPDRAIRALGFLIEKLSRDVIGSWDSDGRPLYDWRSDRFFFRALKTAVASLFDALEPDGEMRPPPVKNVAEQNFDPTAPEELNSFRSPEERGEYVAKMRWKLLLNADPDIDLDFLDMLPDGSSLKAEIKFSSYGMARARSDLKLKVQGEVS